jgi:hypothetical protein
MQNVGDHPSAFAAFAGFYERHSHRRSRPLAGPVKTGHRSSNRNSLDLIERDLVTGAIIELGGAGAFVRRHSLGIFESAA